MATTLKQKIAQLDPDHRAEIAAEFERSLADYWKYYPRYWSTGTYMERIFRIRGSKPLLIDMPSFST